MMEAGGGRIYICATLLVFALTLSFGQSAADYGGADLARCWHFHWRYKNRRDRF